MKNNIINIRTPLDHGKKDLDEILEAKYTTRLRNLTFVDYLDLEESKNEILLPPETIFLRAVDHQIFKVNTSYKKIHISLVTNYIIKDVRTYSKIFNDKTNKKKEMGYIVTLENNAGKVIKDIELSSEIKNNSKNYQELINKFSNGFLNNFNGQEFSTFIDIFLEKQAKGHISIYTNAGKIGKSDFLYKNAVATADRIYWAENKNNQLIKIADTHYVKLAESSKKSPVLCYLKENPQAILNNFINNIFDAWGNSWFLVIMALGQMLMSVHFSEFASNLGVPALILFGSTGSGKSTIISAGLGLFGMSKDALTSGGSTAKSIEFFISQYNGISVCIDDVKASTIESESFVTLIKGAFSATPRTKMQHQQDDVKYVQICSPIALSTNSLPPSLPEIRNRVNIIEIFGSNFQPQKWQFFESNKKNYQALSLILPEFLKIPYETVFTEYQRIKKLLEQNNPSAHPRVLNNLAYSFTGVYYLLTMGQFNTSQLDDMFDTYAKEQIAKYNQCENVVDTLLNEIPYLINVGILNPNENIKFEMDNEKLLVLFNKKSVINLFNQYFKGQKKSISEEIFSSFAKNHQRFKGTKTVYLKNANFQNKRWNAHIFDVTGIDGFESYYEN